MRLRRSEAVTGVFLPFPCSLYSALRPLLFSLDEGYNLRLISLSNGDTHNSAIGCGTELPATDSAHDMIQIIGHDNDKLSGQLYWHKHAVKKQ